MPQSCVSPHVKVCVRPADLFLSLLTSAKAAHARHTYPSFRNWPWMLLCVLLSAVSGWAQTAVNFSSVAVGSTSSTTNVTLQFSASGTVHAVQVLTMGATGLDFSDAGGGSCTTGSSYNVKSTCTVAVTFSPKYPGQRKGAVELMDSNGSVLATTFIYGTGTGPQVAFPSNNTPVNFASESDFPSDVAVDGSGNVFVVFNSHIQEFTAASGYTKVNTLANNQGFSYSAKLAVDGAGNIFVVDGSSMLFQFFAASGYTTGQSIMYNGNITLFHSLAFDGSGNVFISDYSYHGVYEITAASGYLSLNALATHFSFSNPEGVAVDSSGNVFLSDTGSKRVYEITAASGYDAVNTLAESFSFSNPSGLALLIRQHNTVMRHRRFSGLQKTI